MLSPSLIWFQEVITIHSIPKTMLFLQRIRLALKDKCLAS